MSTATVPVGLARRWIGPLLLFGLAVSASGPLIVQFGGIPATYAGSGVIGVPISFIVVGAFLAPIWSTYAAASQYVGHPAPGYALVARGLGSTLGLSAATIALVCYLAIQVSLYGLFGSLWAPLVGGPWWTWASGAWLAVAIIGMLPPRFNARVIAGLVVVQVIIGAIIAYMCWAERQDGTSFAALKPQSLLADDIGNTAGGLIFTMAAFVGPEIVAAFQEEVRGDRMIRRTLMRTLLFLVVAYAIMAWAMSLIFGPDGTVAAARENALPFAALGGWATPFTIILGLAIVACMAAFHNAVARYSFALGRERVLPRALTRVRDDGALIGASRAQSLLTLGAIIILSVFGLDPFEIFVWLSSLAALGILLSLVLGTMGASRLLRDSSIRRRSWRDGESALTTHMMPALGIIVGLAALALMAYNANGLLGVDRWAPIHIVILGVVAGAGALGIAWGLFLRVARPTIHREIGRARQWPGQLPDSRLRRLIG